MNTSRARFSVRMKVGTLAFLSKDSPSSPWVCGIAGKTPGKPGDGKMRTKARRPFIKDAESLGLGNKERENEMSRQEEWSAEEQEAVWERGTPVDPLDPDEYRMDAAGALMQRDAYGKKHRFGWLIDGIASKEGEETDFSLLRPLFWKNKAARQETPPRKFYRYQSALELNVNHFFAPDI